MSVKKSEGFTAEERAAMMERAQELKAEAQRADGDRAVLAKIAEMQGPDRAMAERLHEIVKASAPALISTHAKDTYEALDEYSSLGESAEERRAATVSLGDKPLMVLSAGAREFPGFSQEQSDRFNEAWTRSQADLTRASRNSEQIIAKGSGHNVQVDDPELVIDAIRQVEEAARNGGSV